MPRTIINKSANEMQNERKKKKTGNNKNEWRDNGEARDPRIPLPSTAWKFIISKSGRIYTAAVESSRWQRIKRLLDIRTGSPGRSGGADVETRASICVRADTAAEAAAMDAECVKACVITRYLCVQIPLSRLRGWRRGWKSILLRTYRSYEGRKERGLNMERDRREK